MRATIHSWTGAACEHGAMEQRHYSTPRVRHRPVAIAALLLAVVALFGGAGVVATQTATAATSGWYVAAVPGTGADDVLLGSTCANAVQCWAVGISLGNLGGGNPSSVTPLIESWNGTAWTILPLPLPGGEEEGCSTRPASTGRTAGPSVQWSRRPATGTRPARSSSTGTEPHGRSSRARVRVVRAYKGRSFPASVARRRRAASRSATRRTLRGTISPTSRSSGTGPAGTWSPGRPLDRPSTSCCPSSACRPATAGRSGTPDRKRRCPTSSRSSRAPWATRA